jgi:hypothetical protein
VAEYRKRDYAVNAGPTDLVKKVARHSELTAVAVLE